MRCTSPLTGAAALLLLCIIGRVAAVLPTQAASSVMELGKQLPEISRALSTIKSSDPALEAYLADKGTVCTFLAPTNTGIARNAAQLGKYAGKAAQDANLVRATLQHHVIPGKALSAEEVGRLNRTMTKANQTLFTWRDGDTSYVYGRPDYPIPLQKTDIKAGKCVVHTIDMALVPPADAPRIAAWLDELGTWPPKPATPAPTREPLPGSLELKALTDAPPASKGAAPAGTAAATKSGASSSRGAGAWAAVAAAGLSIAAAVFV